MLYARLYNAKLLGINPRAITLYTKAKFSGLKVSSILIANRLYYYIPWVSRRYVLCYISSLNLRSLHEDTCPQHFVAYTQHNISLSHVDDRKPLLACIEKYTQTWATDDNYPNIGILIHTWELAPEINSIKKTLVEKCYTSETDCYESQSLL
jgi:hypothetical protein